MTFASRLSNTATRLLTKYGTSITVTRNATSAYNPDTGIASTTSSTYTGVGNPEIYSVFSVDNINILATDIKLLFKSSTVPLVGDTMSINGSVHRVENVKTDIAQNTDILYTLQLRK